MDGLDSVSRQILRPSALTRPLHGGGGAQRPEAIGVDFEQLDVNGVDAVEVDVLVVGAGTPSSTSRPVRATAVTARRWHSVITTAFGRKGQADDLFGPQVTRQAG